MLREDWTIDLLRRQTPSPPVSSVGVTSRGRSRKEEVRGGEYTLFTWDPFLPRPVPVATPRRNDSESKTSSRTDVLSLVVRCCPCPSYPWVSEV